MVIGGGLLGLEAARGLQVRGCEVTVVHLMDTLMERQLDATGGEYLKRRIESLGIRVMLPRQTAALLGNGHVDGLRFATGEELEAELVVIAAGIRPNAELGRQAGLEVNRGIVVNDFMETSDPDIFAVGECTEHRGQTFGLVAPLFDQARVLAATITDNRGPVFTGAAPAAKLKIMGVDIFSAGSIDETEAGRRSRPLRRPCTRRLQEAAAQGQPSARDDPGRRRSKTSTSTWTGCAAGRISRPLRRQLLFPPAQRSRSGSGRYAGQRNYLRMQRRAQGGHHPGDPQARDHDARPVESAD